MNRTAATLAVMGAFSLMLVGTSKPTPPALGDAAVASPPPASSATIAPSGATPPDSSKWKRVRIAELGVDIATPPGAKIEVPRGGANAIDWRDIVLKDGLDFHIADRRSAQGSVAYRLDVFAKEPAKHKIILRAPDALASNDDLGSEEGWKYAVFACKKAGGHELCVDDIFDQWKDVDHRLVVTEDDALEVVAVVRSLAAAP